MLFDKEANRICCLVSRNWPLSRAPTIKTIAEELLLWLGSRLRAIKREREKEENRAKQVNDGNVKQQQQKPLGTVNL